MIRASDSTYHTWLERGQHQVSSGDDKDKYKDTQIQIQGQRQRQTHTQMMGESPRPDEIRRMEIGGEFISNLNPHPPTSTHKHTQTQTHKHTHTCRLTQIQIQCVFETILWKLFQMFEIANRFALLSNSLNVFFLNKIRVHTSYCV